MNDMIDYEIFKLAFLDIAVHNQADLNVNEIM
jgi:hypothetical protein